MSKLKTSTLADVRLVHMQPIIDQFLAELDVFASSKQTYGRSLKQFFLWLEDARIRQPGPKDLVDYKDHLTSKSLSPRSIANYLSALKQFFKWTQSMGFYPNIAAHMKPTGGHARTRFHKDALTVEQVIKMLDVIDRSTTAGLRDYAMINLMVRAGLRSIEVARANIDDLQQKDGRHILWVQGKGRLSKDDFVVLNEESIEPIRVYLRHRVGTKAQSPLFVSVSNRNDQQRLTTRSIRRVVKKILKDIDLDSHRLTCHSLRHTAVTLALKAGAPIRKAQRMARHASVLTTERYAHDLDTLADPAEDRVAEILQSPPPGKKRAG